MRVFIRAQRLQIDLGIPFSTVGPPPLVSLFHFLSLCHLTLELQVFADLLFAYITECRLSMVHYRISNTLISSRVVILKDPCIMPVYQTERQTVASYQSIRDLKRGIRTCTMQSWLVEDII
jgi:hypothetical protein